MREGETVAARGSVKLAFTGAVELTNTAAEGGTESVRLLGCAGNGSTVTLTTAKKLGSAFKSTAASSPSR